MPHLYFTSYRAPAPHLWLASYRAPAPNYAFLNITPTAVHRITELPEILARSNVFFIIWRVPKETREWNNNICLYAGPDGEIYITILYYYLVLLCSLYNLFNFIPLKYKRGSFWMYRNTLAPVIFLL